MVPGCIVPRTQYCLKQIKVHQCFIIHVSVCFQFAVVVDDNFIQIYLIDASVLMLLVFLHSCIALPSETIKASDYTVLHLLISHTRKMSQAQYKQS